MKIGRVTGTVTATIKDGQLTGQALLIVDIEDGYGNVMEKGLVAVDTCSAGPGDMVLVTTGSAARLPAKVAGIPVDATIIALIDNVDIQSSKSTSRRKQ